MNTNLRLRLLSELVGTALLLCIVIGSGIMGVNLSQGNDAIALLANTMATVFGLYVLIELFGPIGGAHFNPVVTATMVLLKRLPKTEFLLYLLAQLAGAALGAWLANVMFGLEPIQTSTKIREGLGIWVGEITATFGLLTVILLSNSQRISSLVAAYIGAAYWFTSSTSFANPAAVFGRMFSDTFAGIAPESSMPFVLAECLGAVLALALFSLMGLAKR
ncbi:aquaporin [Limnobacter humi]|uniref:Aquaporin n=1 Tax=Limnobacter humi TaxID=1778671 RepID=A0ABT1WDV0_9BURK|nr:aquaporin [Limnobacter humi]MCQ8895698.1 aquaporin [Limnobacter humi]